VTALLVFKWITYLSLSISDFEGGRSFQEAGWKLTKGEGKGSVLLKWTGY